MNSPVRKLNPLLRLAAISGVETAINLHIRRGDDLDASDGSGATPLILAAARRRKGAVRLLLSAGANPAIADESGMNALAHAIKGGCPETIALLTDALAHAATAPEESLPVQNAGAFCNKGDTIALDEVLAQQPPAVEPPSVETKPEDGCNDPGQAFSTQTLSLARRKDEATGDTSATDVTNEVMSLDDEPLNDLFTNQWEPEEEISAPKGDDTIAEAVRHVHEAIGRHKVVDSDEDWGDVYLHLPARVLAPAEN